MTRRTRLIVVLVVGLAAFVVLPLGARVVGAGRVHGVEQAVRRAAADARISPAQILTLQFQAGENPIAAALHVDPESMVLSQPHPPDWCVAIEIRRLIVTRQLSFAIKPEAACRRRRPVASRPTGPPVWRPELGPGGKIRRELCQEHPAGAFPC